MKLKKELIGSKVWHSILNQYILIEEGNEEKYERLGMDVFEKKRKPKLQKAKKDVKDSKRRDNDIRDNSDGADNNSES